MQPSAAIAATVLSPKHLCSTAAAWSHKAAPGGMQWSPLAPRRVHLTCSQSGWRLRPGCTPGTSLRRSAVIGRGGPDSLSLFSGA